MRALLLWLIIPMIQESKQEYNEDDDAYVPEVDVLSDAPRPIPVPFGHIFKEGIEDPHLDLKQPIDALELSLRTPLSRAESERLLKEAPPQNVYKIDKRPYLPYREDLEDFNHGEQNKTVRKISGPTYFDFEAIHKENMANPGRPRPDVPRSDTIRKFIPDGPPLSASTRRKMEPGVKRPIKELKWTNCTEFAKKSSFHPKDIVDIDWTPFYIWSTRSFPVAIVHRFTYPTKKIVKEYKKLYESLLDARLDWEQPKLMLNESVEMLLIADPKDRRGLFHAVPRRPVPDNPELRKMIRFTVPKIRLKIVDPYLALTHCDEFFATIMATPGNSPADDREKIEEASTLNFTGNGYPVERDFKAEINTRRLMLQLQKEAEEVKYIKAVNLENLRLDRND